MNKAVLSNRIFLSGTQELFESLVKSLTYVIPPRVPGGHDEILCDVNKLPGGIISIPIGCTHLIPEHFEIIDKRINNVVQFPKFKFDLFESQKEVYDKVDGSCLIRANPSWGKTFTSVAIASKLSQKTLVVVHTKALMEQWVGEVKKSLGFTPGIIAAGKYKIDHPITVGTIQSIRNKVLEINNDKFGTIIVDECHHLPANIFKTQVDKFKAIHKIGLSATPWRKDGKHVILKDYLGNTFIDTKDERRLKPDVVLIDSGIKLSDRGNIPWADKLSEIYESPEYIELITNIAERFYNNGYKVLVVADRIEFLNDCADIIDIATAITSITKDRSIADKPIVFGTTSIFAEGINDPPLSCLILAQPINNEGLIEQLLGRISREYEGKKHPMVVDIVFDGYTARKQAAARLHQYSQMGLTVHGKI